MKFFLLLLISFITIHADYIEDGPGTVSKTSQFTGIVKTHIGSNYHVNYENFGAIFFSEFGIKNSYNMIFGVNFTFLKTHRSDDFNYARGVKYYYVGNITDNSDQTYMYTYSIEKSHLSLISPLIFGYRFNISETKNITPTIGFGIISHFTSEIEGKKYTLVKEYESSDDDTIDNAPIDHSYSPPISALNFGLEYMFKKHCIKSSFYTSASSGMIVALSYGRSWN